MADQTTYTAISGAEIPPATPPAGAPQELLRKRKVNLEEKKQHLAAKIDELQSQLTALEEKARAKERERQRKEDDRSKILLGALVLQAIAKGGEPIRKWATDRAADALQSERDKGIVLASIQRAVDRRKKPATTPPNGAGEEGR